MNQFLEKYKQSIMWVNRNPKKAAKPIVAKNILNSKRVAEISIPRCNMNFQTAAESKEIIEQYLSIFYSMNPDIIGGKIPDEGFYYKK
jgi:NitT/TauT family transport system substrate-binding protein